MRNETQLIRFSTVEDWAYIGATTGGLPLRTAICRGSTEIVGWVEERNPTTYDKMVWELKYKIYMNYEFDPAVLELINQEARQCFLDEDAPIYLESLEQGLRQLANNEQPDYEALMRAAHSVKGGAGIAQMPGLSQLAHKIEDLLEAWNQHQLTPDEVGLKLLQRGIEELAFLLNQVQNSPDLPGDSKLLTALDEFNHHLSRTPVAASSEPKTSLSPGKLRLIKATLESDLEKCLVTAETLLLEAKFLDKIAKGLNNFVEECTMLGEAFELPWLVSVVAPLAKAVQQSKPNSAVPRIAKKVIDNVRTLRDKFLHKITSEKKKDPKTKTTALAVPENQENDKATALNSQLRIPLKRLDDMGSVVGELINSHERISIQHQQMKQASYNLKRLVEQVKPVRDRVQSLYDQMSTVTKANYTTNDDSTTETEFDSLEMDRYTALHSSLQTFEELITQIQETRVDIDLVNRELAQELQVARLDLDQLYNNVTQSRLVSFKTFAQRFLPQVQRLNQRCGKSAQLLLEGENVLMDKLLLEQLQTPLTHLFNNALDHGIEKPNERVALDKPKTAQILLQAKIEGSEVAITFQDDGRGIDLLHIYQKAVERGLCPHEISMNQLRREEILAFIFQSGFSTSKQVSDISGRGVGLDIVRTQVRQLRGSLEVDTVPGKNTKFTIRLPLSLSLLSLLLCQAQQQIFAIPTDSVLEVILYSDLQPELQPHISSITWREQVLPLLPLMGLLPYENFRSATTNPQVVLILNGAQSPLAVTVDAILDERQLIIKPFDDTVFVPPYLAGCTTLGTGEVVPVLLPRFLKPVISKPQSSAEKKATIKSSRTILIAEDSTGARRSLERILTQAGFTVIVCRDGQEALDELQKHQQEVDLVISDIEMPRLNGFDLLQKIRTHSSLYNLPVVMLTSRTGDRHRQKGFSLGANAYLGKPITPTELLAGVDSLLV